MAERQTRRSQPRRSPIDSATEEYYVSEGLGILRMSEGGGVGCAATAAIGG